MTATSAPFGARAVYHPSGIIRPTTYYPAAINASACYKGDLVKLTGGTDVVAISAANDASIGVFDGCKYFDATGKPVYSPYWPASLVGVTNIEWYVIDDILTEFEIQMNGSAAATAIGDSADIVVAAGSAYTGISASYLNTTLKGAAAVGNFRIMGAGLGVDNAFGDAYTILRVKFGKNQQFTQVNSI